MNYFAPGLRELARILLRLGRRLQLAWQQRQLAHVESQLGLLGWQQADYDHGTQRHVDRLTDYERAQVQLTNQSAALGLSIQDLEGQKKSEQAEFETHRVRCTEASAKLAGPVTESEQALAGQQREIAGLEARIAGLDREVISTEQKYRALLAKGDSAAQSDVLQLQQRVIAIPREKEECEGRLKATKALVPRLEMELEQRRAMLAVETEGLRKLEKDFVESGEKLDREIATRKRDKQKLERQINSLEKSKAQPYREIGRALADQRIEPVNQPEALTAVLAQREKIAAQEKVLAESLRDSAQENRQHVWISWLLLLLILIVLIGGVWLVLRSK